ncbi:MAG: phosphoribosylformylglycinamidine synthase subunit PurL [Planctomycetes bacterium]|nr:phosphoribosylformylglycinamidine synthase subunit PurL [Planctomycetota bacterium]
MLWEVEIVTKGPDAERLRVEDEYALLTHAGAANLIAKTSRGFLLLGELTREHVEVLANELLVDHVAEAGAIRGTDVRGAIASDGAATVLLKPGVMDPVAMSVIQTAQQLGVPVEAVQTFRRYFWTGRAFDREAMFRKVLCNEAIERVLEQPISEATLGLGSNYTFHRVVLSIRQLDDAGLMKLSKDGQLSLSLDEMKTIQAHFRELGREPTDVELETIAQTWSEHCSHKTLKGIIEVLPPSPEGRGEPRRYNNLLKETIFGATQEIRRRLGKDDWCVSVFEDNAGVVKFDNDWHVCFKVETHNHPSAIEPYGGANTGIGGVIRDPLGTGMGAKPICNTDVFCFAPPDTPPESLPPGVLHPKKVMKGVVAGVRDYGNRMGIPTINGAVCFDPRYLGNPLVYCGTVGLIPADKAFKAARAGDLIVAVGGRTGRDGIHGATFSSIELTSESEKVSGGAVQIGNAITEKKMLDVLLQARDQNLYHAITDCGAGGFSSAVGEMGEKIGARVDLDKAPLKYQGLSYTEIWISEAQERMILAVPQENWDRVHALCANEEVEATVIGVFEATGKLRLHFQGEQVADIDMHFLHDGRPPVVRKATLPSEPEPSAKERASFANASGSDSNAILLKLLGHYNVCSKEWIIRQYDHEVQGGSVLKPLVGVADDGPGDASVITPVLGSWRGLAIGCGINPNLGDLDPYTMAAHAIDEAVRNVVAVGADPSRIALLDNFCWGNTQRPETLGSLVRAAEACRDVALAYMMPFISGKDSLNNEFAIPPSPSGRGAGGEGGPRHIVIPPTLLISAMGQVPDVRHCVSMDFKEPGNRLFLIGTTTNDLGGSLYHVITGQSGGRVPPVDVDQAPRLFAKLHEAIRTGMVRSCHDLSEGGLAVAAAEMAFAGGIGADIEKPGNHSDVVNLFAEAPTRFLVEVRPQHAEQFCRLLDSVPVTQVGKTLKEPRLRIAGASGEWIVWLPLDQLKAAWQKPLAW